MFALYIHTQVQGCVCGVKFLILPKVCWQNYTTDFAASHNDTLIIYIKHMHVKIKHVYIHITYTNNH